MTSCPLAMSARTFSCETAVIVNDQGWSYKQLDDMAVRVASNLTNAGIRCGDRVAFQLANDINVIAFFFACMRVGAIACPISTRLPSAAVQRVNSFIGSKLFVNTHKHSVFELSNATIVRPNVSVDSKQPATFIFSSGSTGQPKAVVHTLAAHLANARGSNENIKLEPGDRWLLSLPTYHVGGLGVLFRSVLAGATIVIDTRSVSLGQKIVDNQVTHLSVVATQLKRMLAEPLAGLRLKCVLLGGSALPTDVIGRGFDLGLPLRTTYGLTEMASQVTTTPEACSPHQRNSAGVPLPYREVAISSEGEILVRGETLFAGYFDGGKIVPQTDTSGWFHTRDLGRLDDDGFLFVSGRADNMFISGGENIHAEEIENRLLDHPSIIQAVVVPVADKKFGERPVAFVEANEWDENLWRNLLENDLPRFKIPDHFFSWPNEIQSGIKPNRARLRKIAAKYVTD